MDRYWPRQFEEMVSDPVPVTWINEPAPPDNVRTLVRPTQRSLHAVLCEALTNTQAVLTRLEAGVTVLRQEQREGYPVALRCHAASGQSVDRHAGIGRVGIDYLA
jgi:hypothetical protein